MAIPIVDRALCAVFSRLLPALCRACGCETTGEPVCPACAKTLPWNEPACRACALPLNHATTDVCPGCLENAPPHDRAWAAFRYAVPVSGQIVSLKFSAQLAPAWVLGTLMAARLARRAQPLPDLLVPVPLHPRRLRMRGYNQALELARALSRGLSIALEPDVARRLRATREQTHLSATERRRNLRGSFAVENSVRGRHVALVDDVITTGATAAELARATRRAGAARIEVWAAARTA